MMMNKGVGSVLSKSKTKVKDEGKKKIKEKVLEQLPTKEELIEKLISAACSVAAQKKMEKVYNKIHGLMSKLEGILLKAKAKVDAIKAKINKVKEMVLPSIKLVLTIFLAIIIVVKILIILAPLLLSFCPPIGGGPCIQKLCNIIIKAANIVGALMGTIKACTKAIKKYMKIALTILAAVMVVINIVNIVLAFVQRLKAFIEFLYLMYLQMCNTSDESVMDEDGNINQSLLETEILKNDVTGIASSDIDLGAQGLAGVEALKAAGYDGSGITTDADGNAVPGGLTNYNLGDPTPPGLGGYGGTGIIASGGTYGQHKGLGNDVRKNNELYGISEKLTNMYEDLLIELKGKGKMEIVEHLEALDFGFKTRFERKIVPIT